MEKAVPINTCLGVLHGRDCIYLDLAVQDESNNMTLTGEINGALVSLAEEKRDWFPFKLVFQQVLASFSCELDTYENLAGSNAFEGSSFDRIDHSTWLQSLPVRKDFKKDRYQHYRLFTYDVVYHLIAVSFTLEVSR